MDFYVSPRGHDANPGTKRRPFATLTAARDAVRALKREGKLSAGGTTVWLRGGWYELDATFKLVTEDSGSAESPITYCAFPGEEVRLIGGRCVTGFKQVTEPAVLNRLEPMAHSHVLQTDLKAQGITDLGKLRSRGFSRSIQPAHLELFFNDQPMTLARWPNNGFLTINGVGQAEPMGDGHGGQLGALEAGFYFSFPYDRPKRWISLEDIWVHGYWAWDWANSYEKVSSINQETGLIKTVPPHGVYGFRAGQRFYFLNILEELDEPGEYYVDRDVCILYFWPPAPVKQARVSVSLLEQPLITLHNASHVRVQSLIIECTRGHGVQITGGSGNLVAGCTIRNVGNYAVWIEGGVSHSVLSCDIYQTGDGGVYLSGGDRQALTRGSHVVSNCHIHHVGRWSRCYYPAVLMSGVGNHVSHSLIHDLPHCSILFTGNEHIIDFNEFHHVCLETGDVGVIYTGRDWTYRGNQIHYNFIHDTGGVGMGSMGVYLDDCVSGVSVFGNVFYKVTRAAFIGGGRDNTVENNIFVDCSPAVHVDGRGLDKSTVWRNMVYKTMKERLDDVKYHQPPYSLRYPELAQLDEFYGKDNGVPPEGNKVARNVCLGGTWLRILWHADPNIIDISDNLVDADPCFIDPNPEHLNFQLRDESPAYGLGFQRIPFEEIGLYRGKYRTQLPASTEVKKGSGT